MILVDTDVVSQPLRRAPEPRVAEWLDAQPRPGQALAWRCAPSPIA